MEGIFSLRPTRKNPENPFFSNLFSKTITLIVIGHIVVLTTYLKTNAHSHWSLKINDHPMRINVSFFVVCWQTMKINQVTEKQIKTKNSKGEWTLSRTRLAWWLVETAALVRPRSGWGGSRDQPPGQSSPWQGPRAFTIFGRDFVVRIPDFFSWSVNRPQVIFLVFEA